MATLPLTRCKHLLPYARLLGRQGEPVERILHSARLPIDCLRDPEMLVPVGAVSRFRASCAHRTGLPDISLRATQHLQVADLGDFGRLLSTAPTLRQSLRKLGDLVGTQSSDLAIDLHQRPNCEPFLCHRFLSDAGRGEWHNALYVLSWTIKIVRLADPDWSPGEIFVDAKPTPERFDVIESLGAVARFGKRCTGFVIPEAMLALPPRQLSSVENHENGRLEATSPSTTFAAAIEQLLRSYARDGWLSIEAASEASGTSVRTIQRRLADEATTYSNVLEDTRADMASELLETTHATVGEISQELGYANQGDFTRAFRRWSGVTPSAFRRRRQPTE